MFKHIQIVLGQPPVGREVDGDWISGAEREIRLALAAPDLYAALIQTMKDCEMHGLTPPDSARQAIIAATGEEP